MGKDDVQGFCKLIEGADKTMGAKPRDRDALMLMFNALRQYSLVEITTAVCKLMLNSPYLIKPTDIVRELEGTAEAKSAEAWQLFKRAIIHNGSFDSVAFGDPAIHWAILKLGGWEYVAREYEQMNDRDLGFREKDFRQLYERGLSVASFDTLPGYERVPRYLWGECERNNRLNGFALDHTPIYAVDKARKLDRRRNADEVAALEAQSAGQTISPCKAIVGETVRRLTA